MHFDESCNIEEQGKFQTHVTTNILSVISANNVVSQLVFIDDILW